MITKEQYEKSVEYVVEEFRKAGIIITDEEKKRIEVADFGLGILEDIGLQLLTYVNTEKCCAKEMVLKPFQTCPEHTHIDGVENGVRYTGKEETFRVRKGTCYLYVEGEPTDNISAKIPEGMEDCFTCMKEIILNPGEQYTIYPNTLHWFQAGEEGAIVSEFSTKSRDEFDIYTDKRINPAGKRNV